MKTIQLTQGFSTTVDDKDFPSLSRFKWFAKLERGKVYAARMSRIGECVPRTAILMHRIILGVYKECRVDHKDGNGLNNQRINLRPATHMQNCRNSKLRSNNETRLKGVSFHPPTRKFRAYINADKKQIYLGLFKTAEEAHTAYREAAIKYHADFARFE